MFAGTMLMLAGTFHIITWSCRHLIGGILVIVVGLSIMKDMYGRTIAAVGRAVFNFAWPPYREWWAVLIITI